MSVELRVLLAGSKLQFVQHLGIDRNFERSPLEALGFVDEVVRWASVPID
jgi:hypothetical protein